MNPEYRKEYYQKNKERILKQRKSYKKKSKAGEYIAKARQDKNVERRCLSCEKDFMAETRFIRMCEYCRKNA